MRYTLRAQAHKGRVLYWITRNADGEVMDAYATPEHTRAHAEHGLAVLEAAAETDAAWARAQHAEAAMQTLAEDKTGQGFPGYGDEVTQ